ncbi:MAG: dihydroneopterin aldolase [Hyphomicrobiales bacterium]|nr:MAG: dihydroneopterin aldolase [Hyphomicrobiales bacterium]
MTEYVIRLHNCAFFARHGLFNEEETLGQRFFVDAELVVNGTDGLENDDIEKVVDYGAAFQVIERIISGKRRFLIEALALDVAKDICSTFSIVKRATITIRKPSAPVQGILDYAEVSVTYPQNDD